MGLLAGAFNDGIVRIIDIREEWIGSSTTPICVKVSKAAWEYSFGEEFTTTCVAWKSYTEVVVGGSNGNPPHIKLTTGFVAVYDLSDNTEDSTSTVKFSNRQEIVLHSTLSSSMHTSSASPL